MKASGHDWASGEDDVFVVSDLHIGRGRNPETGRFFTLEAFFYDDDFLGFCRYLCTEARRRAVPFTLVLNGDVFDLIRVEHDTSGLEGNARFGPPNTPEYAAHMMRLILAGHPIFVRAIAEVIASGNRVFFLSGNHDIETQWEPVRSEIRSSVAATLANEGLASQPSAAMQRLVFRSWFYYEPGRIWVEHGCQYDPQNAFCYLLRGKLTDVEDVVYAAEHDMPLGNFFQRYLYNGFGHITFIVPAPHANVRYLRWLLVNEPRLLLRVLWNHVPFAAQVLRRIAKATDPRRHQLKKAHEQALARIAASTGLGDKLSAIERIMRVRPDLLQTLHALTAQLLKSFGIFAGVVLLTTAVWLSVVSFIDDLGLGFTANAFLLQALNLLLVMAGGGGLLFWLLRRPEGVPGRSFVEAAQTIVDLLDVPVVSFGHVHEETVVRLRRGHGNKGWYFNTGTWIAVFTSDVLLPRERVQYTFLRVRGRAAELLHWSPGRSEALPVILLDESTAFRRKDSLTQVRPPVTGPEADTELPKAG